MPSVLTAKPRNTQTEAVGLLLAGSVCLLPFLLPYHEYPILTFQAEWLAAALGTAGMVATVLASGVFVRIPLPVRWLLAFALFLIVQAFAADPAYPQLPLMAALYVLYAALLVWLGAQLAARAGIDRAASVIAACLLAGALANAAAGTIQFYGRPPLLEDIIAALHHNPQHNGAYGNIAQANLYANYLALGGTALLFLWQRGGVRVAYALAAAVLLAFACALSGSRGALLYALWFALLGALGERTRTGIEGRRFKFAAYGLAAAFLVAQLGVPWFNHVFHLGPASQGALERSLEFSSTSAGGRWHAWILALRSFAGAPFSGVGIGEYAGAAFALGLSPAMAQGEVWTSPHNLPLHLLAETGAVGTILALGGLCAWIWQAACRYCVEPRPAPWWVIAAVGIELIHSMFEFPLWNAQFLGVTALLVGLGTPSETGSAAGWRWNRMEAAAICAALALALAALLRDYIRLDETHVTGTSTTLSSAADVQRDTAVMRTLTGGLLAPTAELWIFLGAPLDRSALAQKVAMSGRLARHFPSNAVMVRRAVFLAFAGETTEARRLLAQAMHTFPQHCRATAAIVGEALAADRAAVEPLLALVGGEKDCR